MAEQRPNNLSEVSSRIGAAALGMETWNSTLSCLTNTFGGAFSTFELIDKKSNQVFEFHGSSGPEIDHEYLNYYMPRNPRIQHGLRRDADPVLFDHCFISDGEMDRNEFYMDFLRPFDLRYFLSFRAFETKDVFCAFTLQRSKKCGAVAAQELELLANLAPVLSLAAESYFNHGKLLARAQYLENALEHINEGVVHMDLEGRIVEMNDAAQKILRQSDGLVTRQGQLTCAHPEDQEKFCRVMQGLCDPTQLETAGRPLAVRRPSRLPAYVLRLHRNTVATHVDTNGKPVALIAFLHDPCHERDRDVRLLCDAFGLTPAEANVAIAIETGLTASEYAQKNSVSLPTVRTQLQKVMQKTHVNRQADLVRILSSFWAASR